MEVTIQHSGPNLFLLFFFSLGGDHLKCSLSLSLSILGIAGLASGLGLSHYVFRRSDLVKSLIFLIHFAV